MVLSNLALWFVVCIFCAPGVFFCAAKTRNHHLQRRQHGGFANRAERVDPACLVGFDICFLRLRFVLLCIIDGKPPARLRTTLVARATWRLLFHTNMKPPPSPPPRASFPDLTISSFPFFWCVILVTLPATCRPQLQQHTGAYLGGQGRDRARRPLPGLRARGRHQRDGSTRGQASKGRRRRNRSSRSSRRSSRGGRSRVLGRRLPPATAFRRSSCGTRSYRCAPGWTAHPGNRLHARGTPCWHARATERYAPGTPRRDARSADGPCCRRGSCCSYGYHGGVGRPGR